MEVRGKQCACRRRTGRWSCCRSVPTNVSIGGGPGPVRAYIEELLPDVLEGRIEPGRVFDRTGSIEDVPDGYRAMNEREVLKFEIRP